MALARSILFAIVFYPGTLLYVLSGLVTIAFGQRGMRAVVEGWARFHRVCTRVILGIRTRVEGTIPQGPALIAVKHQSMFETIELVVLLDTPAIVMKRELADIPLWGALPGRYGVIVVDREGGASALRKMAQAAEAAIAQGRQIVIFPEGTRVAPGAQPPLLPGFAGLYRVLGLPVVPLALDSGRLWPRRRFVKRSGTITLRFGQPIPPCLPRREIEARVHAAINALEV